MTGSREANYHDSVLSVSQANYGSTRRDKSPGGKNSWVFIFICTFDQILSKTKNILLTNNYE
jgi:hypothetical protein